jgi:diguanylate cyclase (GGDEF)-like protein
MSTTAIAALWPVSALLVGFAAWIRPAPPLRFVRIEGWRTIALPAIFALTALAVIAARAVTPVNRLALALAVATLATVIVRMVITLSEHMKLLVVSRGEALTDSLTGLSNRRKLMLDLDERIHECADGDSCALLLFDLDGFKQYNDWHGHPAGDALLRRLGDRLEQSIADAGECYRLGGDEFCVIARGGELQARRLRTLASEALAERGDGFDIGTSVGLVMMPRDAASAASVLQLADERLYSQKARRRRFSVGRQTSKALVQALEEREPHLRDRIFDVAQLAREVSAALGLKGEHLEQVVRAAELHDVGRVAVPDAILLKTGPLDDAEWENMREHALAGDRILSAAPALEAIAKLVRASHERFDGHGYPDKLAGDEIPLGARIVAVCDAFNAMTSDRPHQAAMARDDAVDELRRCAGAQFDPAVVEVVAEMVSRRPGRAQSGLEDLPTIGTQFPTPTDAA